MPKNSHRQEGSSADLPRSIFAVGAGIVGIVIVVIVAILFRSGGFQVVAQGQGARIELKFDDSRVDLGRILDQLLKEAENGPDAASKRRLVASLLQAHDFYRIPSAEAAAALREIKESAENRAFAHAVRRTLYDLAGPFARPATLLEAGDDRLLLALDDLYEQNPTSPVVVKLWEMSLDMRGIFEPRDLKITVREDKSLSKGIAATCAGNILLGRVGLIRIGEEGRLIGPRVEVPKACGSNAAAAEKKYRVWLSPADMSNLVGDAAAGTDRDLHAILTPLPKNLGPEGPG